MWYFFFSGNIDIECNFDHLENNSTIFTTFDGVSVQSGDSTYPYARIHTETLEELAFFCGRNCSCTLEVCKYIKKIVISNLEKIGTWFTSRL